MVSIFFCSISAWCKPQACQNIFWHTDIWCHHEGKIKIMKAQNQNLLMGLGWKGKCRNKAFCYWWNYGIIHWIFSYKWCGNYLFYFKGNSWDVEAKIKIIFNNTHNRKGHDCFAQSLYLINYLSILLSIDLLYP